MEWWLVLPSHLSITRATLRSHGRMLAWNIELVMPVWAVKSFRNHLYQERFDDISRIAISSSHFSHEFKRSDDIPHIAILPSHVSHEFTQSDDFPQIAISSLHFSREFTRSDTFLQIPPHELYANLLRIGMQPVRAPSTLFKSSANWHAVQNDKGIFYVMQQSIESLRIFAHKVHDEKSNALPCSGK